MQQEARGRRPSDGRPRLRFGPTGTGGRKTTKIRAVRIASLRSFWRTPMTRTNTMMPFPIAILCTLALTACSGGGGGGGGELTPTAPCDPGDYRPATPNGLGVAGLMDGTWQVVSVALLPDPRTRNADVDQAYMLPDETIEFRAGLVFEGDEDPTEPGGPNGVSIPVALEFYCNEPDANVTLYGFGIQIGANTFVGQGVERMVGIFGTTGATTARAILVEETVLAGGAIPAIDRFQVVQVELEKVTSFARSPSADVPSSAASPGPSAGEASAHAFLQAARRQVLCAVGRARRG